MSNILDSLYNSLIVSCQAPVDSPLNQPKVIAAIATTCVRQGAKALRINTPAHIAAVREALPTIPIIGLWKQEFAESEIYITPRFVEAEAIALAGADIIAIDATQRLRPGGEQLQHLIARIQGELGKLVMADVDNLVNGLNAADAGADVVATTLYGYTPATKHLTPPAFTLIKELSFNLQIPVICEGGISSPQEAKAALDLGAYAVVVGTAITGIDHKVSEFLKVFF